MHSSIAVLALLGACRAQETVLGVYMFHRHGDRTPKALAPANLTDLGYAQVLNAGAYYRERYISTDASARIDGLNADIVQQSQISVSAPDDTVLMNSAQGFLQALYPPVGAQLGTQALRNGSSVENPMKGYQLIPVSTVSTGSGSENNGWLQDATDCGAAETSSNSYLYSAEAMSLTDSTNDFYQSLLPVVNATFDSDYMSYKNAYTIFDLINVATIHNQTIPSDNLLTPEVFQRLGGLANTHEFNLAYNKTSEIRGIAGMQLAAEAIQFFSDAISTEGSNKLGIQFGAYGTFQSYFGLADLTAADELFYGIPDYASSMVWELFTNADTTMGFPSEDELSVRFFFHNGTASSTSPPVQYPLFGGNEMDLSWSDFMTGMNRFAVGTTEQWCTACGNSTGQCAQYASEVNPTASSSSGNGSNGSLSNVVCGVIGAMVTLGVVLLVQGAIIVLGGLTVVRRKRLNAGKAVAAGVGSGLKA